MKKALVYSTFCILLTALVSYAQPRAPRGGGGGMGAPGLKPEVNAAMIRLFGKNAAFSAKSEAKIKDKEGQNITMTSQMAVLDGKVRTEMDMANIKGPQMPPEATAQMKQMGMDKVVSLNRPDIEKVYIIYPNMKSYAEMELPKVEANAAKKEAKVEKTELGKETVEGHPCIKNKVVITDDEGKSHEMTVWNATDLKDFPIKMVMNEEGTSAEILYKDIKFAKPDAKEFEPPAEFKKYANVQQMIMEKMMGGAGNMGAPGQ